MAVRCPKGKQKKRKKKKKDQPSKKKKKSKRPKRWTLQRLIYRRNSFCNFNTSRQKKQKDIFGGVVQYWRRDARRGVPAGAPRECRQCARCCGATTTTDYAKRTRGGPVTLRALAAAVLNICIFEGDLQTRPVVRWPKTPEAEGPGRASSSRPAPRKQQQLARPQSVVARAVQSAGASCLSLLPCALTGCALLDQPGDQPWCGCTC